MGSKRPYTEVEPPASLRDPASKKRKQSKNHKPKNGSGAALGQSLNEIKKRARDIERRFAKGDQLPADVQRNLERELAHCKGQIEDLQHKKKRNEMISKYHKVRFFGTCEPRGAPAQPENYLLTRHSQRGKKPKG